MAFDVQQNGNWTIITGTLAEITNWLETNVTPIMEAGRPIDVRSPGRTGNTNEFLQMIVGDLTPN